MINECTWVHFDSSSSALLENGDQKGIRFSRSVQGHPPQRPHTGDDRLVVMRSDLEISRRASAWAGCVAVAAVAVRYQIDHDIHCDCRDYRDAVV